MFIVLLSVISSLLYVNVVAVQQFSLYTETAPQKSQCNFQKYLLGNHVEHVHQVDYNNNKWLFRGGSPDIDPGPSFAYHHLRGSLEYAAKNPLPKNYQIVDIDLMNFDQGTYDDKESRSEFEYFQQNPSHGSYVFWHTEGTKINATSHHMDTALRTYLAKTFDVWGRDRVVERMAALKNFMNATVSQPTVYYIHCDCGCDRTGLIGGSYYMTYMGLTWEQANSLNAQIAGRPMDCGPYLAMQWYCLYLNEHAGMNLNCLNNQPCH